MELVGRDHSSQPRVPSVSLVHFFLSDSRVATKQAIGDPLPLPLPSPAPAPLPHLPCRHSTLVGSYPPVEHPTRHLTTSAVETLAPPPPHPSPSTGSPRLPSGKQQVLRVGTPPRAPHRRTLLPLRRASPPDPPPSPAPSRPHHLSEAVWRPDATSLILFFLPRTGMKTMLIVGSRTPQNP